MFTRPLSELLIYWHMEFPCQLSLPCLTNKLQYITNNSRERCIHWTSPTRHHLLAICTHWDGAGGEDMPMFFVIMVLQTHLHQQVISGHHFSKTIQRLSAVLCSKPRHMPWAFASTWEDTHLLKIFHAIYSNIVRSLRAHAKPTYITCSEVSGCRLKSLLLASITMLHPCLSL